MTSFGRKISKSLDRALPIFTAGLMEPIKRRSRNAEHASDQPGPIRLNKRSGHSIQERAMIDGILSGKTPAVLFRRYCSDGSGALSASREERIFVSTLQRAADCMMEAPAHQDGEYFIATDERDLEHDVVLAMFARGELIPPSATVTAL